LKATLNGEEDKEGKRDSVEDLFFAGRVGSAHY
jgi:hypothetical protein